MAARKNLQHSALTRERIKTGMLVKRLSDLAEGVVDMPPHAVTAALGLLRKVMPDLQAVQHSGDADRPVALRIDLSGVSEAALREFAAAPTVPLPDAKD